MTVKPICSRVRNPTASEITTSAGQVIGVPGEGPTKPFPNIHEVVRKPMGAYRHHWSTNGGLSWPSSSARFTATSSRPPSLASLRPRRCADDRHRNCAAGPHQYRRFRGPRLRRLSHELEPRDPRPTISPFGPLPKSEGLIQRSAPSPNPPLP
jgi:hypothetical protein